MKQTVIPDTDLRVSRFTFGTASLLRVGAANERGRLLAAAYDNGFTHFDTAPYYGFGTAERDLRALLAAHPDATVTTKVGLYAPGGEEQPTALILLRKVAGKIVPALSRPAVDFSVKRARRSLSGSLRRLGRERVDLYLLHEAELHLLDTDEWLRWLESERDRVKWFGIALTDRRLAPFLESASPLARVVQTVDSIAGREADAVSRAGRALQFTYGYLSAAGRVGATDADAILGKALQRNRTGSVIISTRKIERLPGYARIADLPETAGDREPTA